MKTWKPWPGTNCPDCGSSCEILSSTAAEEGDCQDGDLLRCEDPYCPRHTEELGYVSGWDDAYVGDAFEAWPLDDNDQPYKPEGE